LINPQIANPIMYCILQAGKFSIFDRENKTRLFQKFGKYYIQNHF
jgi:hypothetical protein